jgi:hypothetical protein
MVLVSELQKECASLGKRYGGLYKAQGIHLQSEFGEKTRKWKNISTVISMDDWLLNSSKANEGGTLETCDGWKRLTKLRLLLDQFKWKRTKDQTAFHEDFIKLTLPHIFKDDFERYRVQLMRMFKIETFKVGALILCPRRWGKTVAVAMFVAAMLMVCDNVTIATFSSGQRASSGLMTQVIRFVYELGGEKRVVVSNEECFQVALPSTIDVNGNRLESKLAIKNAGKVNKLFAYPASAKGTKTGATGPCFGFCIYVEFLVMPFEIWVCFKCFLFEFVFFLIVSGRGVF